MANQMDEDRVELICRRGQESACCKYLMFGPDGFDCGKAPGNEMFAQIIAQKQDMVAQSDNCPGVHIDVQ